MTLPSVEGICHSWHENLVEFRIVDLIKDRKNRQKRKKRKEKKKKIANLNIQMKLYEQYGIFYMGKI
jgi:hypothetical protein